MIKSYWLLKNNFIKDEAYKFKMICMNCNTKIDFSKFFKDTTLLKIIEEV